MLESVHSNVCPCRTTTRAGSFRTFTKSHRTSRGNHDYEVVYSSQLPSPVPVDELVEVGEQPKWCWTIAVGYLRSNVDLDVAWTSGYLPVDELVEVVEQPGAPAAHEIGLDLPRGHIRISHHRLIKPRRLMKLGGCDCDCDCDEVGLGLPCGRTITP